MASLSLARIMYGTNEDFRALDWTAASALAPSAQPISAVSSKAGGALDASTLGGILRKAWFALTASR